MFSFLVFASLGFYIHITIRNDKREASKKFLGYYKLNKLDRSPCKDCRIKLNEGYRYDVIVGDKVVGGGKWWLESAVDIPGYFLQLEGGPNYVIWAEDRVIEGVTRSKQSMLDSERDR